MDERQMTPKEMAVDLIASLQDDADKPFVIGRVKPVCEAYLELLAKTE